MPTIEKILNQVQEDVLAKGGSDARRIAYFLGST